MVRALRRNQVNRAVPFPPVVRLLPLPRDPVVPALPALRPAAFPFPAFLSPAVLKFVAHALMAAHSPAPGWPPVQAETQTPGDPQRRTGEAAEVQPRKPGNPRPVGLPVVPYPAVQSAPQKEGGTFHGPPAYHFPKAVKAVSREQPEARPRIAPLPRNPGVLCSVEAADTPACPPAGAPGAHHHLFARVSCLFSSPYDPSI